MCSDGAGSAEHSEQGAMIVCDKFIEIAARELATKNLGPESCRDKVLEWCEEIRNELKAEAALLGVPVRELACTFLAAVIAETYALFIQIGDGAMVISSDEGFQTVFWPQSGEYANTTNFLTDDRYAKALEICLKRETIHEFAAFTDGLERLILRFADQTVHGQFLSPLMRAIRSSIDIEPYFEHLRMFLRSDGINHRTNDDKTLILASRVPGIENDERSDQSVY